MFNSSSNVAGERRYSKARAQRQNIRNIDRRFTRYDFVGMILLSGPFCHNVSEISIQVFFDPWNAINIPAAFPL